MLLLTLKLDCLPNMYIVLTVILYKVSRNLKKIVQSSSCKKVVLPNVHVLGYNHFNNLGVQCPRSLMVAKTNFKKRYIKTFFNIF
jgi:hypothetical protein